MNILITGATGFIGTNLVNRLKQTHPDYNLFCCSSTTTEDVVLGFAKKSDFIFYLAAVHRPNTIEEFKNVNYEKFNKVLVELEKCGNACPVLYTSSIQAGNNTPYGDSKILAEDALRKHSKTMGSRSIIYRLTNTFGRYGRPNGHSVVATFCFNIQHGLEIKVNNPDHMMTLYFVDDVVSSFLDRIDEQSYDDDHIYYLPNDMAYNISLGEISTLLYKFKNKDYDLKQLTELEKKLLITFESYK